MEDQDVEIDPYDPSWPARFDKERRLLADALDIPAEHIEHIGSTAIPGLASKPLIDIMIGVGELCIDDAVISRMAELGYEYFGEFGIAGRHFFRKGHPRTHHLHWVARGGDFWEKQLLFRDYLRTHPAIVRDYENLKRIAAVKYRHDRPSYTKSKTEFVERILTEARARKDGGSA